MEMIRAHSTTAVHAGCMYNMLISTNCRVVGQHTCNCPLSTAALQELRRALHGNTAATANLAALVAVSPSLHELLAVWDAQVKARSQPHTVALLLVVGDVMHTCSRMTNRAAGESGSDPSAHSVTPAERHGEPAEHADFEADMEEHDDSDDEGQPLVRKRRREPVNVTTAAAVPTQHVAAAVESACTGLVSHMVTHKMKHLYACLSSDTPQLHRAATVALAGAARLSQEASRQLLSALDTGLPALAALLRPPK
jgi:hypothetical protein